MLEEYKKEILSTLPKKVTDEELINIKSKRSFFLFGFCDMDLTDYDFSACSPSNFSTINFNSNTVFPQKSKLPNRFDTKYIIKCLKNKKKENFFSENKCYLAVIDNPATLEHEIYKNAKIEFVPYQDRENKPHFHLHGVLSNILLNYNTSNLSLIAYTHSWAKRAEDNLKALKDVEKRIKNGDKIFAVSISDWLLDEERISPELIMKLKKQIEKLKKLDCTVIDSQVASKTKAHQSYYNRNTKQIELGYFGNQSVEKAEQNIRERGIILMQASPIYADCGNAHGYVADFCPGWSWIIPQISYLFTQAKAQYNIDFEKFSEIFQNSFSLDKRNLKLFNLKKLISNLEEWSKKSPT